jgi:hypothetical protein
MLVVRRNTYPNQGVPHGEPGDEVEWQAGRGRMSLVRLKDGKGVFAIDGIGRDGNLYSTKKPPVLIGVIGEVRSKGWIFEIEERRKNG